VYKVGRDQPRIAAGCDSDRNPDREICPWYNGLKIMGDPLNEMPLDFEESFSAARFIATPESTRGMVSGDTLPELLLLEFKLLSTLGEPN
jgi:hypothetical protein